MVYNKYMMRSGLVLVFALVHLASFAQNTHNDSIKITSLEEVSIVATKTNVLPGAGQYIAKRQLEKLNQFNVNNVLRTVPGVNIRDEEGFGLRPNIGLRGTAVNRSAKITLMEDGILVAPAPYTDPSAYYFPSFARMQGVEVLKGSSQIKYGPYTIGGALNLLSTALPTSFKGYVKLSYGSFGTQQQRVWLGNSSEHIDYVFEVNRLASMGFKQLDNGGNTGFERRDMMGKVRWHTKASAKRQQHLTLKLLNASEQANETYLGLTYDDYIANPLRRYSGTQNDLLSLQHEHVSLSHQIQINQQLSLTTAAYYNHTFRAWDRASTFGGKSINSILADPIANASGYDIMTGKANGTIEGQATSRTYFSRGVQTNLQYTMKTRSLDHKLQLGVRYHQDQADRYATASTYSMTSNTIIATAMGLKGNKENQVRDASSIASYLSYDLTYRGLQISPGIRYEKIHLAIANYGTDDNARLGNALKQASNDISVILPGLGLNYKVRNVGNVFAGIHRGFSPPGMPSTTSTASQAKAENAINYELGGRVDKHGLQLQATAFLNKYSNILGSDNVSGGGVGTGDMFNAGKANIYGAELEIAYNLLQTNTNTKLKLPISLAYTYTNAKFLQSFVNGGGDWGTGSINQNDVVPFVTPHLLAVNLGFETKRFNATLSSRYTSTTRTKPGQGNLIVPSEGIAYNDVNAIAAFIVLDASANYNINKRFAVFATANNLSNTKAIVANLPQGYRPNMPLSLNAGLKLDL
ncbi:MAG: Iron(III) dicitrate transport protein FecA [Bacteroidota bacterium]